MTTYQTTANGYVARKVQSLKGTAVSGAGASILRVAGGAGKFTKGLYESQEVQRNLQRTRGRHGSQRASASYPMEWSLGVADDVLEALFRGTLGTTPNITNAT